MDVEIGDGHGTRWRRANAWRMRFPVLILICYVGVCLIPKESRALDRHRRISQYAHTAWRLQDGYLNGTPTSITQTKDGYIWIGTQNALIRFDGVRFVPWVAPKDSRLPSPSINTLAPAEDGGLWIGTTSGLAHWTGSKLVNFQPGGRVNQIFIDRNRDVWITRSRTSDPLGPLCKAVDEHLECHGRSEGLPAVNADPLSGDSVGNLWLGNTDKLIRWGAGQSHTYSLSQLQVAHELSGVEGIAIARDNSVWVGFNRAGPGLGLQRLIDGVWTAVRGPSFDGSSLAVTVLFLDREDVLWVGTVDKGIFRVDGGRIDHFDSTEGLSGDLINDFEQDREGNIWVTTTKGIDSFRDLPVATFSKQQGLSADEAASITAASDGTIWIGNQGSLDRLRNDKVSAIRSQQGLPGQQVTSVLVDHAGVLWVGVDNSLYRYIRRRFLPVPNRDGGPVGFVTSLAQDRNQNVWAHTFYEGNRRLVQIGNGRVQREWSDAEIPARLEVLAGPSGDPWLNIYPGALARFPDWRAHTYTLDHPKDFGRLFFPFADPDGSLWASSQLGEVSLREGTFHVLSKSNGLPCNYIYASIKDRHGSLWLYAECGLIRIESNEIVRWLSNPSANITVQTLDVYAGTQPSLATFSPMATRSPDGRLWFANDNIVQMIDPDHLQLNPLPPPVLVEQLISQKQVYTARNKLTLPPNTKDIQIDYTALSFVAPRRVHFRVKLVGHDVHWVDVDTRRSAFYTNLSPGAYEFLVSACNNDGVWNDKGASLHFFIMPAWYQTLWFRVFCGLCAPLACYSLYLIRLHQHSFRMKMRFNERLEERTRIARHLHDTLLQTIQGSKLIADHAEANTSDPVRTKRSLKLLSEWLGRATLEGRTALESLRATEATDLATALRLVVEDYNACSRMNFSLSTEGSEQKEMDPVIRDEVYWIGYEVIRNAHTHSDGRQVSIHLTMDNKLLLHIRDDGRGIPDQILREGKVGHFGLTGIRERASHIGAVLTISSSSLCGTDVTLVVPGDVIFLTSRKTGRRSISTRKRLLHFAGWRERGFTARNDSKAPGNHPDG